MNTYTWSIKQIFCNNQNNNQNVVYRILWKCEATDGTFNVIKSDKCEVPYDTNSQFISYESLTESQVLSWVWTVVNKSEIESVLDAGLAYKNNPLYTLPLPWN